MTEYHTIYKGREETTQWDDIQRKLGNLAPKEKPFKPDAYTPDEHEAATSKRGEDWIATCDDPGELSDAEDEFQDDEFLEKFRQQRIKELENESKRARFGSVEDIRGSEFVQKVSQAGEELWVVTLLYKEGHGACKIMSTCLDELAIKHPCTKFVRIISTDAIPNYPDTNLPTLLIYKAGRCEKHVIGLATFGGVARTSPETVALALNSLGPICQAEGEGADEEESADMASKEHVRALVRKMVAEKAGDAGGARRGVKRGDDDESSDFEED